MKIIAKPGETMAERSDRLKTERALAREANRDREPVMLIPGHKQDAAKAERKATRDRQKASREHRAMLRAKAESKRAAEAEEKADPDYITVAKGTRTNNTATREKARAAVLTLKYHIEYGDQQFAQDQDGQKPIWSALTYRRYAAEVKTVAASMAVARVAGCAIVYDHHDEVMTVFGRPEMISLWQWQRWHGVATAVEAEAIDCLPRYNEKWVHLMKLRDERIGLLKLRHLIAGHFSELRDWDKKGPDEAYLLHLDRSRRLKLGGVVWDNDFYLNGFHKQLMLAD